MEKIRNLRHSYWEHLTDKNFMASVLISLVFLAFSLWVNFYAGMYTFRSESNSVSDIVLSNIQTYNLDNQFVYGSIIFFFFIVLVCLIKPEKIPFTVKSIALFVIIRCFFTTLTHLAPFPTVITIHSNVLRRLSLGGDLFFSGHTGMPFLLALIYWKDKIIRNLFLIFSFSFAIIVLLAHIHYSIDVVSAFFITYSIYHISKYLFKKEYSKSFLDH